MGTVARSGLSARANQGTRATRLCVQVEDLLRNRDQALRRRLLTEALGDEHVGERLQPGGALRRILRRGEEPASSPANRPNTNRRDFEHAETPLEAFERNLSPTARETWRHRK